MTEYTQPDNYHEAPNLKVAAKQKDIPAALEVLEREVLSLEEATKELLEMLSPILNAVDSKDTTSTPRNSGECELSEKIRGSAAKISAVRGALSMIKRRSQL
jgi:hypothetical protein